MKITAQQKSRFETRAAVLKALAHPIRLFMIEQLALKPYCVCELTEMVELDISTVSKHLSVLKNAGLIQFEKKGKEVHYRLRMRCALTFLDCVESVLKEQARDRIDAIENP
jgi:ArsR family transcriptional regulator